MAKQYKLLKDLPYYKAGVIYEKIDNTFYQPSGDRLNGIIMKVRFVENNPEWFEEIVPFEWTDKLVMEYVNQIIYTRTNYGWEVDVNLTLDQFKKSKQ